MTRQAAQVVAEYIHCYCQVNFSDWKYGPKTMASTITNGQLIDVFDHKGYGTHKYIPADRLTTDLGKPIGAGVYGYWRMHDDSYLLLTCDGPLAYWSGKEEDKAYWAD